MNENNNINYDALICGAGIPGLYAARELARAGLKVIILDRSKTPGEPNYSTAGIPKESVDRFNIPKEGINEQLNQFILATSNHEAVKKFDGILGYVLDFRRTKALMAEEVVNLSGEVKWDTSIEDVIKDENGKITGVLVENEIKYFGKYIIDATGVAGLIVRKAGIVGKITDHFTEGAEYIIKAKGDSMNHYNNTLSVYLDTKLAPHGYFWIFANGNNTYKVGVIQFWADPKEKLPSLTDRIEKVIDWLGRDKIESILEHHGGGKLISEQFKQVYKNHVIGIGDSIGAINPLFAEGIRQGLHNADFAVKAILENENNHTGLENYSREWKKYNGFRRKFANFFARFIYLKQSQKLFEIIINIVDKKLTAQDFYDVGFMYKFEILFKKDFFGSIKALLSKYNK